MNSKPPHEPAEDEILYVTGEHKILNPDEIEKRPDDSQPGEGMQPLPPGFEASPVELARREDAIVSDIFHELRKQGERDLPSVPGIGHFSPNARCLALALPSLEAAKLAVDVCTYRKMLTRSHVAIEHLCEIVSAQDDEARRQHLVNLAAELVGWIECIDRRAELIGLLEASA